MHHLHNLQQVVLGELGKGFGQLLHVDILARLLTLLLRLPGTCCAVDGLVRGRGLLEDLEELILGVTEGLITVTYTLAHFLPLLPRIPFRDRITLLGFLNIPHYAYSHTPPAESSNRAGSSDRLPWAHRRESG